MKRLSLLLLERVLLRKQQALSDAALPLCLAMPAQETSALGKEIL